MDSISEVNKKKTKRVKRGISKTKRNFKKKIGVTTNFNSTSENISTEDENNSDGFFKNLFSWFNP